MTVAASSLLRRLFLLASLLSSGSILQAQQLQPPAPTPAGSTDPANLAPARRLIAASQFPQAEAALRAILAQAPRSADARYLLAYTLLRQNRPKEALEQYTQAAALRTPTPTELNDVAKAYVLLEDFPDAARWLTRSLDMDPKDPETWYNLGRLRFTEQKFADAADCFQRALSLAPTSVKVENNLGLAYYGLNRPAEAEAAYRQALQWQDAGPPQDASEQPLLNLGTLLVEQGQLPEARSLLTRALAIAPQEPRIHEQLGQIAMQQADFALARDEFQKASQLDPGKSNLHFLLGQALRRLGHQEDAKREFDTAARLSAQHNQ
jgi:Flp pilus assembly protein TadD